MSSSRGNEKERERVERQRSRKTTDTQRAVERADWLWLTVDSLARDLSSRLGLALPGLACSWSVCPGTCIRYPWWQPACLPAHSSCSCCRSCCCCHKDKENLLTIKGKTECENLSHWAAAAAANSKREQQHESYRANYAWLERHRMSHIATVAEWQDCVSFETTKGRVK